MEKADGVAADEVIFDLEDSVAPSAKQRARELVVETLRSREYRGKVRAVRINDVSTAWCHQDVIQIVEGARERVDTLVVPKVESRDQVVFLDLLLTQLESRLELGPIGLELQIETAKGVENAASIAAASPRAEALVFGPLDLSADLGLPGLNPGRPAPDYPGDFWHYVLFRLLTAARASSLQVIDGPWLQIHDTDGLRTVAARSAALGYDGKWALNPVQIEILNEVFSPRQADVDRAHAILEAYRHATDVEATGAVMLDGEMIDEASRKLAQATMAKADSFGMEPGPSGR